MSKPTHPPKLAKVAVLQPPQILGTVAVDSTIEATLGTWSGKPMKITQEWTRDDQVFTSPAGQRYTIPSSDAGHRLQSHVTATNAAGSTTVSTDPVTVPAPVPAPPPPPPPTPSGDYYAGIVARRLQYVWDFKLTAGIKIAPNKTPAANPASLPPGAILGSFNLGSDYYLRLTQDCELSGWDFTGLQVIADGCVATATNCRLKYPGGGYLGTTDNGGFLKLVSCDVDASDAVDTHHGVFDNATGCRMKWTDLKAWGAPSIYVDNFGLSFERERCYIQAFGLRTSTSNHGEAFKTDKGSVSDTESVIDITDGGTPVTGFTSAGDFCKADSGVDIDWTYRRVIINFPESLGLPWTCQAGIDAGRAMTILWDDCVMRKGSSGFLGKDDGIVVSGTVYDLVTAEPFTF